MGIVQTILGIAAIITTLLGMSKLRGGFNYRWEYVLSPLLVSLLGAGVWQLVQLFMDDNSSDEDDSTFSHQLYIHEQKVKVYDYITPIFDHFFYTVCLLDLAEFLNRATSGAEKHPDADRLCFTLLGGCLVSMFLRINRAAHLKSIEMIDEEGEESYLEWKKNTKFPVIGILLNQIFNILGATTMVCAGGACNSIYISSLTLFFSSIGITLTDWLPYLNGLGFIFVIVALLSLYSAKKSVVYPPFIIGCLCSLVILCDIVGAFHSLPLLVAANLGMIGCSLYNLKANTAPLRFKKKKKHRKHQHQRASMMMEVVNHGADAKL
jgi:hypothetical protein